MFLKNRATLLITLCFSSTGLCFALNKNCLKTQPYVTGYASPPWNSSVTFLVFYLCKQKCSSDQCQLNCLKGAVWISVNGSFSPTSLRCRCSPKSLRLLFPPFCFLNHTSMFQGSSNLFKVQSWSFWRQGSGFTKRGNEMSFFQRSVNFLKASRALRAVPTRTPPPARHRWANYQQPRLGSWASEGARLCCRSQSPWVAGLGIGWIFFFYFQLFVHCFG